MAIVTDNQLVTIHENGGHPLYQFSTTDYSTLTWTRDQNNPSTMDLAVPPILGTSWISDVAPWVHWATVWDGDDGSVLWTGPIQKVSQSRKGGLVINAKDPACYLARTRCPESKMWANTDPAFIAQELWRRMGDRQGLRADPIALVDVDNHGYDYTATANDRMLDQVMSELVDMGMVWTVVSGVPIIGPLTKQPICGLSEKDFVGDDTFVLVRDGSAMYNDVLVKAEGSETTAHIDYYGQNLETIKNLDHISGVSNVTFAAQAYVGLVGRVRTRIQAPNGAQLHPNTEVTMDQLIPSTRFMVSSGDILEMMQLTRVEVSRESGTCTVKITPESVLTPAEISELELNTATSNKNSSAGTSR